MTATAAPTVNDQKLVSLGLVEMASVNSIPDLTASKFDESNERIEKDDFANTFICHIIFYVFLCVSILLHILIDLGLGSFIKNKFVQLIGLRQKINIEKRPVFA